MLQALTQLFTASLNVFSEERRRHFMAEYLKLRKAVDDAQNAYFPYFSRTKIALAEQALVRFLDAYSKELQLEIAK